MGGELAEGVQRLALREAVDDHLPPAVGAAGGRDKNGNGERFLESLLRRVDSI